MVNVSYCEAAVGLVQLHTCCATDVYLQLVMYELLLCG